MRIHVGAGAAISGIRGYRESLAYARERKQGTSLASKSREQVPIIQHADVKRMLLQQKAYAEGGLALCMFGAGLLDSEKKEDRLLLDALIPLIKSWPSDFCVEANNLAIQVLGGYGYTRDFPLQQVWRDNRLNMIHEGTAGIQSLDLLGRKTRGEGWRIMVERATECAVLAKAEGDEDLEAMGAELVKALEVVEATKVTLLEGMAGVSNGGERRREEEERRKRNEE